MKSWDVLDAFSFLVASKKLKRSKFERVMIVQTYADDEGNEDFSYFSKKAVI
jgi:hypothetical protein